MVATLFYVESVPAAGELVTVDGDEGFHAATVRRIRPGEALALSDGAGALADCVVDTVGKRSVTARVVHRRTVPPLRRGEAVSGLPHSRAGLHGLRPLL